MKGGGRFRVTTFCLHTVVFSVILSLSWVSLSSLPFTEAISSPSSSLSDEHSTCSPSRMYFGGIVFESISVALFLFLLSRLATFCS